MKEFIYQLPTEDGQATNCAGLAEGLSIVRRSGFYHLYYTYQIPHADVTAPIEVCDELEVETSIKALSMLLPTLDMRITLDKAAEGYMKDHAYGKVGDRTREELTRYADNMAKTIYKVIGEHLSTSYAVVLVSAETEEIIRKTMTLAEAVAWCAMTTIEQTQADDETISEDTYRYEVYQTDILENIKENSQPIYKTKTYRL